MAELAAAGKSIVMISSEMPELLGMCDRILVMNEGRFIAEFPVADDPSLWAVLELVK